MDNTLLVFIGMFAAICGSLVGLGGGFIIVPSLAILYNFPVSNIVGTSMAVLVFSSISSTLVFAKQKRIDYKSGALFALAMIPGSILGAWIADFITSKAFFISFGLFMLLMAISLLLKPSKSFSIKPTTTRTIVDSTGKEYSYSFHLQVGTFIAFLVGFLSSLFGIGGGSVMVPTMVLLLTFPVHIATATSSFFILITAVIGSISHMVFDHILWEKVIFLALGSIIGGHLGAKLAAKVPEKTILGVLSTCLIVVAIRLMFN
ncbi:sulfite exporter TauE/SafE family protein [Robertmurraya sp. P23]|uniref:sulfite exporter TauE/SafE family protein n=1 Tax=Robertmurraya sp. P23 TaxID=3436931 RepID=UPI003D95FF4C